MTAVSTESEAGGRLRPYDSGLGSEQLGEAFVAGEIPVAVYGLGKMGLPLAAVFGETCGTVVGADVDSDVVERVRAGESPVDEPGLDELVGDLVADGSLRATADPTEAAARASVHVAVVPTLLTEDREPDLSTLEAVVSDVATGLEPGDLVVVESTVPPGTCAEAVRPTLAAESGLATDEFGVAFCPERTSSGRALEDIRGAYPKVVGGVDEGSTRAAAALYDRVTDAEVLTVSDARTAECVKVFEGIYRDVNIALANELGRQAGALDVDVTEAIEVANTQPFCDLHDPGVGVGGHCIPVYPWFLAARSDVDAPLVETARAVNEAMPKFTAGAVLDALASEGVEPTEARTLVLGLTYRPGVDELRRTPALGLIERLAATGVDVDAVDPVASETAPVADAGATVVDLEDLSGGYDAVVVVTSQEALGTVDLPALGPDGGDRRLVVVDGRQAFEHLRDDGAVRYRGVGVDV